MVFLLNKQVGDLWDRLMVRSRKLNQMDHNTNTIWPSENQIGQCEVLSQLG